jgi:pilus assembly protein CpaC
LDYAQGLSINGTVVPAIRERITDTAVELTAGQTLAIAGLMSTREESVNSGLPWVSEVPYLGAPFRKVSNKTNEIELLILVTPELVDAMDACEVPQCGPGMSTTSPTDWELYLKGHLEVPNCCPNGSDPNSPPSDGMIGPEEVPTPSPVLTPDNRPLPRGSNVGSAQVARRPNVTSSYNRNNSSKSNHSGGESRYNDANTPPPFVGPVGYDVIK